MFGKKLMSALALTILMMSLFGGIVASADVVNLGVAYVEINGHKVEDNERIEVRRGETLDLEVKVVAPEEILGEDNYVENVQIQSLLVYKYSQYDDSVQDMTKTFNLQYGTTAIKDLSVQIPVRMDAEDDMLLHLTVYADNMAAYSLTYRLDIRGVDDDAAVVITEAYMSPSSVMAGRGTKVTVKVKNYGDEDLDDVTLIARIPALNLQDVETLDELEADEKETFENLILRIPENTVPGVYEVIYTLKFDEYESTTYKDTITVLASEVETSASSSSKSMITVPSTQTIAAGTSGTAYPIMITNMGKDAKAYQLTVQGMDAWGTARFDPASTVVVPAGQTVTAFLYVSANEDVSGEKVFQLTVNDGAEQEQISLTANIAENGSDWSGLKKVLEVSLIVLVIILIIIGLVVGFNKLKGSNDEEDDEDKTYY